MDKNMVPSICHLQEIHLRRKDTHRVKVKGWKKIFHEKRNEKTAGVAVLMSDKIDFKIKTVIIDKERHYIIIKGSIQQDITFINVYVPKRGAPKCIKQILTD